MQLFLLALFCLTAGPTAAAALRVTVDGSSPFATLDEAVTVAAPGDTILVGPGHHYSDDLCLEKDLTFISIAGRDRTVIDGQDQHRLIVIDAPAHLIFEDLTFAHGWMASEDAAGAAMLIWSGAHVEIRHCSFEDNAVAWQAGAIHARGEGTVVEISDSQFLRNRAVQGDGACGVQMGGVMRIDNCLFVENTADRITAAVSCWRGGHLEITNSVFLRNQAAGGTVVAEEASLVVSQCTFHNNASFDHGSILAFHTEDVLVENCIITGDLEGAGIVFHEAAGVHRNNIIYGNIQGSVVGDTLHHSEVEADPLYQDLRMDDLRPVLGSPAWVKDDRPPLGALERGSRSSAVQVYQAKPQPVSSPRFH